jgi:hypothetical protein
MTFVSKSLLAGAAFVAIAFGVLWHELDSARTDNQTLRRDLQTETQARNTAVWLLDSQEQTMQVFAAIRAANRAARLNDEALRNESKQKITHAVAHDPCGVGAVPATAVSELQQLEKYAHTISGFSTAN